MAIVDVESKSIRKAELVRMVKKPFMRLDGFVVAILWIVGLYVYFAYSELLGDFVNILFLFLGVVTVVAFLASKWSDAFNYFVACKAESNIASAEYVMVFPQANKGPKVLCPIDRVIEPSERVSFTWRQRTFVYDKNSYGFRKFKYPINEKYSFYASQRGLKGENVIQERTVQFGKNRFLIPMPKFMDLYKEHMMAPFFVFQIFCVLLWCLDDYWYYSLFTGAMLLVFEGTVVGGRLKNLTTLRNMVQPNRRVMAYRNGEWKNVDTYDLVPGDIVSVTRPQDEQTLVPCDMLLLQGSCVVNEAMLTGESIPQLKEAIREEEEEHVYDIKGDKRHTLYCGTKVVMVENGMKSSSSKRSTSLNSPPDRGCPAYVLRTGFETSQGKLIRTILFSTERMTANSKEAMLFILFLLCFAVAASAYVLYNGLMDETRSRYKLMLECTLILTSVVPPELPMELTLAVNNSLMTLTQLGIYCTEPFRIPFAGKVKKCCFDKTGTLTSDKLLCEGIAGMDSSDIHHMLSADESLCAQAVIETQLVVAGCHSLVLLDGKTIGDPMELAAIEAMGWSCKAEHSYKKGGGKIRILGRHHFSSALKRMSTVAAVCVSPSTEEEAFVFAKGAPETIKSFLSSPSPTYDETYRYFMRQGYRVIALAYRRLGRKPDANLSKMSRDETEKDLAFGGFVVFDCPLKDRSQPTLKVLRDASHDLVMITGDNALTACMVARKLEMVQKPMLILSEQDEGVVEWVSVCDERDTFPLSESTRELEEKYSLCVSGKTLPLVAKEDLQYIQVFARVSPDDKAAIIRSLNENGYYTMMCGDGTNDVGALKQAHLGIALLNRGTAADVAIDGTVEVPKAAEMSFFERLRAAQKAAREAQQRRIAELKQRQAAGAPPPSGPRRRGGRSSQTTSSSSSAPSPSPSPNAAAAPERKKKAFGPPSIADDMELKLVQLGDASIAAPFTAKGCSVGAVVHIIRQGRCALVTTLQMFMILALNSLIMAYSLSALYLDGVKLGDTHRGNFGALISCAHRQATVCGMLIAMCFLFISWSRPLKTLSPQRPRDSIFTLGFFGSLLGQFAIHMYSLVSVHRMAKVACEERAIDLEADFEPDLVNTAVFLISTSMQISTFAINYKGRPFMESLTENKGLFYALSAVSFVVVIAAAQVVPAFNEWLELVPMDEAFQSRLLLFLFGDFVAAFAWSRIMSFLFP